MKKYSKRIKLILFLHSFLALLMILIYSNRLIEPKTIEYFEYISLLFPVIFISYCLLIFFWLKYSKRLFVIFSLLLPIFLPNMFLWINFNDYKKETNELKVMNYNVYYGKKKGIDSIESYIKKENPDIILLQEVWSRQWKKQDNLLTDYNNAVFPYVGISTKHQIIEKKLINLYNTNGHACWADVIIKEDTIRAFSIYLEPIYLTKKLFKFKNKEQFKENTKEIERLLNRGFKTHQEQLKFIIDEIKNSPYPVIVGGDLNAVPNSYEYFQLSSFLNDAFKEKGNGLGTTFHDYFYPIKIDFTFFDNNFKIKNSFVDFKTKLSDHFPVITTFKIIKNNTE